MLPVKLHGAQKLTCTLQTDISTKVTNFTVQHEHLSPRHMCRVSQAQVTNLPPSLTEDHTATAYSCTHTVAAVSSSHQSG